MIVMTSLPTPVHAQTGATVRVTHPTVVLDAARGDSVRSVLSLPAMSWRFWTPGAQSISQGKIGYHVAGGAEFPLARWVSLAGELQWATVPKELGETGVSARFDEDNLGGTTFRFKFIVGH